MLHKVELKVKDLWIPVAVCLSPSDAGKVCEAFEPSETRIVPVYGRSKQWQELIRERIK